MSFEYSYLYEVWNTGSTGENSMYRQIGISSNVPCTNFLKNGYFDSFRFPKEAPRTLFRNAVQKIPLVAFWITGENVKTTATTLPLQNRDACCIKFWLSKKESQCKNWTNNDSIELPGPLFSQWNIFPNLKAFLISIPIGSPLCLSLLLFLPLFSSFSSPPPSPFRSRATATPLPPPPPFLWNEKNTRPYRVF